MCAGPAMLLSGARCGRNAELRELKQAEFKNGLLHLCPSMPVIALSRIERGERGLSGD